MPLIVLLWLALLNALSPANAFDSTREQRASAGAPAEESTPSWGISGAPSSSQALRLPARTAAAMVSQSSGVVIPDRSDAPPRVREAFGTALAAPPNVHGIARARHFHAASRGSLVPYFPTAPPQSD
jgi:hypothetical protein